jgi:tetratricopeptide (TPR) repeat protein
MGAGRFGLVLWLGLAGACGAHQPPALASRFVQNAGGSQLSDADLAKSEDSRAPESGQPASSVRARGPEPKFTDSPTIEKQDEALGKALQDLFVRPTAGALRDVGEEYLRLRIFDDAYDHFMNALKLNPRDAQARDGLARVWRDAGFLDLGLSEAWRAVYHAPKWAQAHNTLGTVLYALGNAADAQRQFELAASLDPDAGYPLSNLCYVSFVGGDLSKALEQCGEAVRRTPELAAARANLAAVTAATGK